MNMELRICNEDPATSPTIIMRGKLIAKMVLILSPSYPHLLKSVFGNILAIDG